MSDFGVFPRQVTAITPIPDADRIELATVEGYQSIVGKGTFAVGDWCLYIPEQAILPESLIVRMGLEGKLAGSLKNRVKPVRLRGCLSEGLLLKPEDSGLERGDLMFGIGQDDYAPLLGITKYEPRVPADFAGVRIPAPDLVPWIEIPNIKALRTLMITGDVHADQFMEGAQPPQDATLHWRDPFDGRHVVVTEKVHGTCLLCTMTRDGTVYLSSKGIAKQHQALAESATNVYWRAFRASKAEQVLKSLLVLYPGAASVSLYGEVFGPGVQDLQYGLNELRLSVFDLRVDRRWLGRTHVVDYCRALGPVDVVPSLYEGLYDYQMIKDMAEGPNQVGKPCSHMREGVVVRAVPESEVLGERLIAKFVGEGYLFRKGERTEYA